MKLLEDFSPRHAVALAVSIQYALACESVESRHRLQKQALPALLAGAAQTYVRILEDHPPL